MFTYTITEGASYITDEILLLGSTYSTTKNAEVYQTACEGDDLYTTIKASYYTYSTFYQFTNGNYTSESLIIYSDDGVTRTPILTCGQDTNTFTIGGGFRCPLKFSTFKTEYSSDGKATIIDNRIDKQGNGQCKNYFNTFIYDQPIFGDFSTEFTTTLTNIETTQTINTFIRKHHSIITYDTKNSNFVSSYYYSEYFTYDTTTEGIKETTQLTKKTYDEKKITTKYSRITNSDDPFWAPEYFNEIAKDYNYVNTVVYFADKPKENIALWYRTKCIFEKTDIDKPIFKIDVYSYTKYQGQKEKNSAVTISFIQPSFYSATIGEYDADKSDTKYPLSKTKSTVSSTISKYTSLYSEEFIINKTSFYAQPTTTNKSENIYPGLLMPLSTTKSTIFVPKTKSAIYTLFSYTDYSGFPIEFKQTITKTIKYNIIVDNFMWHNFQESTEIIQGSSSPYDYKYSTCKYCVKTIKTVENNSIYTYKTTYEDYIEYKYIKNFYLSPGNNDYATTFSINVGFVDGMVSPDNLTSFAKEVSLNENNSSLLGESTFKASRTINFYNDASRQVIIGARNYIGGYHWYSQAIFIYPNMPICVPNLSNTFGGNLSNVLFKSSFYSSYFSIHNFTRLSENIIYQISTTKKISSSTTTTFITNIVRYPAYQGKAYNNGTYFQIGGYEVNYIFDLNDFYHQYITPIVPPPNQNTDSFFTIQNINQNIELPFCETYQINSSVFPVNKNIAKYRNDSKTKDSDNITIFCTPGSYIKIGTDISTFELTEAASFSVSKDEERYIYLPSAENTKLQTILDRTYTTHYDYIIIKNNISFANFINCLGNYNIFLDKQNLTYYSENQESETTRVFGLIPLSDRSEYRRV